MDSEGRIVLMMLATDSGYVNIDIHALDIRGARTMELSGPEGEYGPTLTNVIQWTEGERKATEAPTFFSVDGDLPE